MEDQSEQERETEGETRTLPLMEEESQKVQFTVKILIMTEHYVTPRPHRAG